MWCGRINTNLKGASSYLNGGHIPHYPHSTQCLFVLSNYNVFFTFPLLPFSPLPLNLKSPEHLFYIKCLGVVQQTSLRTTLKTKRKTWPFPVSISTKAQEPQCVFGDGRGWSGEGQATCLCLEPVLANKPFEMRTLMFWGCCIATSL